jgi:hypothetical protein
LLHARHVASSMPVFRFPLKILLLTSAPRKLE